MFIDLKKTLFLLATAPLAFGACGGDDDDDGGATPDANDEIIYDAAVPDPDAAPDPTFSGTVSLAEVAVTNAPFAALGVSGAVVNISFTDPEDETVEPAPGYDNNVGACKIFVYDLAGGDVPAKGSDGGRVTVGGTSGSDLPAFACDYNIAADTYACSSGDSAAAGAMPMAGTSMTPNPGAGAGTATLVIAGADFSNETYVGMNIVVGGFDEAEANGRFGIIQQLGTNTLVIVNSKLAAAAALGADSAYQTLVGAGPIPGGFDFLDDGTADVTIAKDAITNVPAIDTTLTVNGEGFALAADSVKPHELPTDGTEATFSCVGSCGTANGLLKGIIVFGETTDGVVDPLDPLDMPDPVDSFATFQCSGIGAESITLDAGAMALIMGTDPTRIQTSVTYANAKLNAADTVVMSHGVVGFTSVGGN